MNGPLHGLKVLEMEGIGPCPLAGQLLADQGAEVTVIGRPGPGPGPEDVNSRGKRRLALDLKSTAGRAALLDLVAGADLLIEGFRPGVMERLGIGPDVCLAQNPRLVFGRMTGWGQQGPQAATAGHDITYLASTGALWLTGRDGQPPTPPLNLVADYGGGSMFLIFGVLAALWETARSGKGQVVDAAMVDGVGAMMGIYWTMRAQGQWSTAREANLIDGGAPYYGTYETSDGGWMAIGAIEPQFFAVFAERSGLDPALAAARDTRADWPAQRAAYAALFRSRSRDEWTALFAGTDACVVPVLTPDEARASAAARLRGAYVTVGGMVQPAPAPRFGRTPAPVPQPPVASES